MYISKVIVTDNFVPDIATDQFRRRIIGYDVTVREGEDYKEAERFADEKIKEYIQANKIENPMSGVQVRDVPMEPVNKESGFIEAINSCTSLKSVEIFEKLVKRENIPALTTAFENKLQSFKNI